MEKIKEALAKAKIKNSNIKQNSTIQHSIESVGKRKASTGEADLEEIVYSQSKVVKLDSTHLEKSRIVSHLKNDVNSVVFDSLRTQVLQKMEDNQWQTIAIVSPTPESGKTVVAINLAISIAQQQQNTAILIDFDLRRPKVSSYLGLPKDRSLNDFLQDKLEIKDILINPGIQRLVVLPTSKAVSKSAEIISSKKVTSLIQELKSRYKSRIVIFDSPPVLHTDDAIVLFKQIDCILLVVADGMSTEAEIEETLHYIPKEKLLGVVINKADIEPKSYYY